ncbi:hypothetical protein PI125_g13705 [Phytophthora idaei]|nr:hypothetical protein PI125_g13705 [Phytophthora idaei]
MMAEDVTGVATSPSPRNPTSRRPPVRITHALEQSEDWVTVSGFENRPSRSCKVCALLRTDRQKQSFATTFFFERCSIDDAKGWLCNKIRGQYKGVSKTCFYISHDDFDCGQRVPPILVKRIVLRRSGQEAGERKKTRRELQLRGTGEDSDDENESYLREYYLRVR